MPLDTHVSLSVALQRSPGFCRLFFGILPPQSKYYDISFRHGQRGCRRAPYVWYDKVCRQLRPAKMALVLPAVICTAARAACAPAVPKTNAADSRIGFRSGASGRTPVRKVVSSALKPLLVARNLRRANSAKEIFNVDYFSLNRGETVALVGPNGAGKTTFLLTLALLHQPTSGAIELDGITAAPHNLLQLRRRMAVVFQEPLLLDMSVLGNLTTALRIRKVPGKAALVRAQKWLDLFGVAHISSQQARSISGGEAQRTSLARAFALEPDLLFLDEPFGSLDYPTRNSLLNDLGKILQKMNMTTLFVTHDYSEIPFLAQNTAVMYEGRIIKLGSNEDIFGQDFSHRSFWSPWADLVGKTIP